MKTKIKGRYIVGYDESRGSHVIIPDGEVVIEDNQILFTGKAYEDPVDRVIDRTDCLIMPGLINAHALVDTSIFQYIALDRERTSSVRSRQYVLEQTEDAFDRHKIRDGARHSMLNMVRGGSTTILGMTAGVFKRWNDPDWEPETYMETAVEMGLRAYLSHSYRTDTSYGVGDTIETLRDEDRGFEGLKKNVDFIERYHGAFGDTIRGLLMPYTLDTVSPAVLKETRKEADRLGVGIRMHFAQSDKEIEKINREHGKTPVEYLEDLGVLGPRLLLTHALYLAGNHGTPYPDGRELELLAERDVSVCNCPWIYTFRGGYLNSFSRYGRAGVNMCIGTDTFPMDMIREMRWAAIMSKVADQSDTSGTAREVFDAATLNAARYLERDDLGRLAPGAKADIVAVDLERFNVAPIEDPIKNLVYFASADQVRTVIVDGEVVVDDFRSLRVDEAESVARVQPVSDHIKTVFHRWDDEAGRERMEFPWSYPVME
ncbi:MAG: chlorohydrolase family protein [Clostridia bacterium]